MDTNTSNGSGQRDAEFHAEAEDCVSLESDQTMLCISIRQPWVHHIFHNGKDIENRDWGTNVRGRVLIHAAKGCTREEWEEGRDPLWVSGGTFFDVPPLQELPRGCIVGSVEIVDCIKHSDSPWFFGRYGFVLRDPQLLPEPIPYRGQLGFFSVTIPGVQA